MLSVNVGLRYEYSTPPIERHNRLANFDPLTGTIQSAKDGSAFVRLRFPGYACACIDSGIPQGWMRKKVAEVCALIDYGYTATAIPEKAGPKFLRITDIVSPRIDWPSVPYCQIEDSRMAKF